MMRGAFYVIDQLGQTILERDQVIAQLETEVRQLKEQVATLQPETEQE